MAGGHPPRHGTAEGQHLESGEGGFRLRRSEEVDHPSKKVRRALRVTPSISPTQSHKDQCVRAFVPGVSRGHPAPGID